MFQVASSFEFNGLGVVITSSAFLKAKVLDRARAQRLESRKVWIAGITTSPGSRWMGQMARNVTLADTGFLCGCRYLLHDREAEFCAAFDGILEAAGIQVVTLPPRSPNLNAHPER